MKQMDQMIFKKLKKQVKEQLDQERYQHTLGVMYTAASLAMCYHADLEAAMYAGLLHDCAKCIPQEKKLELCRKYALEVSEIEQKNPGLLHAKLGAALARGKYGITNEDICHAIAVHTTGCPDMNLLDKILYIADYIEPGRCEAPNLADIRTLAYHDLDLCLYHILEDTLAYIRMRQFPMDPMTEKTYQCYKVLIESREKSK